MCGSASCILQEGLPKHPEQTGHPSPALRPTPFPPPCFSFFQCTCCHPPHCAFICMLYYIYICIYIVHVYTHTRTHAHTHIYPFFHLKGRDFCCLHCCIPHAWDTACKQVLYKYLSNSQGRNASTSSSVYGALDRASCLEQKGTKMTLTALLAQS